uniref:DNA-binding protein n=1 Tax=Oryza meridionalis TaxID=40149 RepID=A0A0E0DUD7_9ORYZ
MGGNMLVKANNNKIAMLTYIEELHVAYCRRDDLWGCLQLSVPFQKVSRIALVKPDKARGVEDVLLRAAQSGGISEKVSEERLISLLEQINTHTSKQTKVTIQRRRSVLDDDD